MQSATERDDWVDIIWDNIQAGTANNFNAYGANTITQYGIDYDYGSTMHYGATAFSINGSATIVAKRPLNGEVMGQRVRMSEKDIARVNAAYCADLPATTARPTLPSIPDLVNHINNWINNLFTNIWAGINARG